MARTLAYWHGPARTAADGARCPRGRCLQTRAREVVDVPRVVLGVDGPRPVRKSINESSADNLIHALIATSGGIAFAQNLPGPSSRKRREAPRRRRSAPRGPRGRAAARARRRQLNKRERLDERPSPPCSCSSSAATRIARDGKRRLPRPCPCGAAAAAAAASARRRCLERLRRRRLREFPSVRRRMYSIVDVAHGSTARFKSQRAHPPTNAARSPRPPPGPPRRAPSP